MNKRPTSQSPLVRTNPLVVPYSSRPGDLETHLLKYMEIMEKITFRLFAPVLGVMTAGMAVLAGFIAIYKPGALAIAFGIAIVLAAGTQGKRFILPHARVMIHQPYGGVWGQTSDVQIQAEEILKAKHQLNQILADHTGKPIEQIEEDSERDRYFSAAEAKDYGLVDEVLEQTDSDPKTSKKKASS